MLISDVIALAQKSELQQLGAIQDDEAAIIGYINLGLIELYKRFNLSTNEVIITIGADGDVTNPYTKISDTIYQMPDDYITMQDVYDESGNLLAINKEDDPYSIFTIRWNQVQIPTTAAGDKLSIIYVTNPAWVVDATETLDLPLFLLNALLAYIGYKAHYSLPENNGMPVEGNVYYQNFENAVTQAKLDGNITIDEIPSRPVGIKGFV